MLADGGGIDPGAGLCCLPGELAGQDPVGQRAPGGNCHAQGLGHRQQFAFDVAPQQAVGRLKAGERRPAVPGGQRIGPGDQPGGGVGDADVQDLPGAYFIVEARMVSSAGVCRSHMCTQ